MKNRTVLRWSVDLKKLIIGLFCIFVVSALHAEVSDDVWKALINRNVIIEKNDESEVAGKLASVADQVVVVIETDGKVVSVPKEDVQNVRVSTASETTAGEVSDDVWKALINKNVIIEKNDGSEVAGKLASVADQVVVVIKTSGKAVSVMKKDVQNVRASTASETTAGEVSVPKKEVRNVRATADGFALSAGVGGAYDFSSSDFKGSLSGSSEEFKVSRKPIDIKAFFDATYIQVSIGYMSINGVSMTSTVNGSSTTSNVLASLTYATFAAYLKYPFVLGPVELFPLLGVQYRLNLTDKDSHSTDVKPTLSSQEKTDLNELWLEAGAGMDIPLGSFFIRPELLIGFKPLSTTDNNGLKASEAAGYTDTSLTYFTFDINLLFGYKF